MFLKQVYGIWRVNYTGSETVSIDQGTVSVMRSQVRPISNGRSPLYPWKKEKFSFFGNRISE